MNYVTSDKPILSGPKMTLSIGCLGHKLNAPWAILDTAKIHREAILDKARMQRGAILAVQGSLSRGAILGLDNIGWSDVM